jgi:hypothetical protein
MVKHILTLGFAATTLMLLVSGGCTTSDTIAASPAVAEEGGQVGSVSEANTSCGKFGARCTNASDCCSGLGCGHSLYGGFSLCVPVGCVNGEVACGPSSPSTICCTGQCFQRDDGYKCSYF